MNVLTGTPLLPAYARFPVTFVDGEGSWLIADDGQRYLDLVAGIAVVGLGHCHPAPLEAAHAQLERLWHVSNLYSTEPMEEMRMPSMSKRMPLAWSVMGEVMRAMRLILRAGGCCG